MVKRIRLHAERPEGKARVTNGKVILPYEDGRSVWARIMRDTLQSLISHCGGDDFISDTRRMCCRRIAALEAELIMHEDRIAKIRRQGKEPPASLLQTYGMLSDRQRRLSECIGWDRTLKNANEPTLADYIAAKSKAKANGHARTRGVTIEHEA